MQHESIGARLERERKERDDFLKTLQKGSAVAMIDGTNYSVGAVERLTATQVIVIKGGVEHRFRRDSGRTVGGRARLRIEKLKPEIRARIEEQRYRRAYSDYLYQSGKLGASESLDLIRDVLAVVAKHRKGASS